MADTTSLLGLMILFIVALLIGAVLNALFIYWTTLFAKKKTKLKKIDTSFTPAFHVSALYTAATAAYLVIYMIFYIGIFGGMLEQEPSGMTVIAMLFFMVFHMIAILGLMVLYVWLIKKRYALNWLRALGIAGGSWVFSLIFSIVLMFILALIGLIGIMLI